VPADRAAPPAERKGKTIEENVGLGAGPAKGRGKKPVAWGGGVFLFKRDAEAFLRTLAALGKMFFVQGRPRGTAGTGPGRGSITILAPGFRAAI